METILTRPGLTHIGDAPATLPRTRATRGLGRLLLGMAQTTAERVVLTQREPPLEWYRYPLP
jgi:hypothetical protein